MQNKLDDDDDDDDIKKSKIQNHHFVLIFKFYLSIFFIKISEYQKYVMAYTASFGILGF